MAVEERERRELQEALMASIGPDQTDTLLGYLPPVGWADVATKQDLHAFAGELRGEMAGLRAELRGEIAGLRGELRGEIAGLNGEIGGLRGEIGGLRGEIRSEIAGLRAEMHHQLRVQFFWMITLWITGLGLLIGLHSTTVL